MLWDKGIYLVMEIVYANQKAKDPIVANPQFSIFKH